MWRAANVATTLLPPPAVAATVDASYAAAYLGISEASLRRLIKARKLPVTRLGRLVRIRLSALEQLLNVETHNGRPQ
jgi:excisionase family DNA binding protein